MTPAQRLRRIHRLLDLGTQIVPAHRRFDWRAEWIAELSTILAEHPDEAMRLAHGTIPDAVTLRAHDIRQQIAAIDWRAPETCLRWLLLLFCGTAAISGVQPYVRHLVFSLWGQGAFAWFLAVAFFALPSTVVTRALRFGDYAATDAESNSLRVRLLRWRFLLAKMVLALLTSYLLAVQFTRPFFGLLGHRADYLLLFFGLLCNVGALNWVLLDQKARCPVCMRSLRNPARIGPPSWSFMDWNGMEEMCDRGHGLMHMPDWETSWFDNPRWLQLDGSWSEFFRQ